MPRKLICLLGGYVIYSYTVVAVILRQPGYSADGAFLYHKIQKQY